MKSVFASLSAALVAAFLLPACATKPPPTMVLLQGDATITLMTSGCPKDGLIAQLIGPTDIADFKEAVVVFKGQNIKACWMAVDAENILIVDEQGNGGMIPKDMFSKTAKRPRPTAKPDDWKHNA